MIARSTNTAVLYRTSEHFGLQFKNLRALNYQLQIIKWHIVKHSADENIRSIYQRRLKLDRKGHLGRGRKTSPAIEVERLESLVALQRITERGQFDRAGIGMRKRPQTSSPADVREQMIKIAKQEAETKRIAICLEYQMQAKWLEWDTLEAHMRKDLTWLKMLQVYSASLLKFTINALANTLPSPDNLRRWSIQKNATCGLCSRPCVTLNHILAGCSWVHSCENRMPGEDRYTWRHNCILLRIAQTMSECVQIINDSPRTTSKVQKQAPIKFIKSGASSRRGTVRKSTRTGLLQRARDWRFDFEMPEWDVHGVYMFPHDVAVTGHRPDGCLISRQMKICIIFGADCTTGGKYKKLTRQDN